jgi:hypothetical protein
MKKILLIMLLSIPVIGIAQNQITLNNGQKFIAIIKYLSNNNILFRENIPGTEIYYVQATDIYSLEGKISATRTKKLLKLNPDLIILPGEFTIEDYNNQPTKIVYNPVDSKISVTLNKSSGNLIMQSSKLRLSGFALAGATAISYYAGAFNKLEPNETRALLVLTSSVSLLLYISGEITLFNAGKALNREAVTLSPASSGIGLAINF